MQAYIIWAAPALRESHIILSWLMRIGIVVNLGFKLFIANFHAGFNELFFVSIALIFMEVLVDCDIIWSDHWQHLFLAFLIMIGGHFAPQKIKGGYCIPGPGLPALRGGMVMWSITRFGWDRRLIGFKPNSSGLSGILIGGPNSLAKITFESA